jgi:hypothetical protein
MGSSTILVYLPTLSLLHTTGVNLGLFFPIARPHGSHIRRDRLDGSIPCKAPFRLRIRIYNQGDCLTISCSSSIVLSSLLQLD